ncbi:hypothetical protein T265_09736 [Opisthorchis viverrini]|uniref:Uncharacterized protein n=1 Tax=Opisthorchis viverrini TaxID=6198 RepID=A0A075A3X0_OPIVI|nr:hypothetical protein T265_09736 [Opisthorchis viverrini]KER22084.1 hypothetical protein T265_09736 [Opisthorchis viverrini]
MCQMKLVQESQKPESHLLICVPCRVRKFYHSLSRFACTRLQFSTTDASEALLMSDGVNEFVTSWCVPVNKSAAKVFFLSFGDMTGIRMKTSWPQPFEGDVRNFMGDFKGVAEAAGLDTHRGGRGCSQTGPPRGKHLRWSSTRQPTARRILSGTKRPGWHLNVTRPCSSTAAAVVGSGFAGTGPINRRSAAGAWRLVAVGESNWPGAVCLLLAWCICHGDWPRHDGIAEVRSHQPVLQVCQGLPSEESMPSYPNTCT